LIRSGHFGENARLTDLGGVSGRIFGYPEGLFP
jgi:hypothetical protein